MDVLLYVYEIQRLTVDLRFGLRKKSPAAPGCDRRRGLLRAADAYPVNHVWARTSAEVEHVNVEAGLAAKGAGHAEGQFRILNDSGLNIIIDALIVVAERSGIHHDRQGGIVIFSVVAVVQARAAGVHNLDH